LKCSEPNDPTRRFCRRCGTSLANAPIHSQKRPWYRRILGPRPQAQAAGQPLGSSSQPGAPGKGRKIKPVPLIRAGLAVIVAIGIVGVIAVPSIQGMVLGRGGAFLNDIRRLVAPELVPVYASGATASSEIEEHPGTLLIDRFKNTDWRAPEATPSVKLTFDTAFDLAAVWVHNGAADNYTEFRRPTRLAFIFSDGSTAEIPLTDDHEPQRKDINVAGVRELEIRVLAATGPANAPLALSEIEFIEKR
jgi:hypothetical protein